MELQSDLTSEFEKETLTDKSTDITDPPDSVPLNTMKHKSIPDAEADSIEPLNNIIKKTLEDSEPSTYCPPTTENSPETVNNQEVPNDESGINDVKEECQKDAESDCSRDSNSNSHCQCPNREEESQSNVTASPGSAESPNDSLDASRFDEIINVDLRRTRRSCKRKKDSDLCCPVCGLTLRLPELESHFNQEVEKLSKIPKTQKRPKSDCCGINTTFVQVRSNRLNRLTAKVSQYSERAKNEVKCPVCKLWIYGSEEEMNNHVALCFQNDESDELINVEDDEDDNESFEEYEIGNETRIRAISLVPGGYRSLHGENAKRQRVEDDEDLDVDVDDTIAFGQPQYSELDLILNKNEEAKACDQLRKAVLVDPSIQPNVLESRKWSNIEREDESVVGSKDRFRKLTNEEDDIYAIDEIQERLSLSELPPHIARTMPPGYKCKEDDEYQTLNPVPNSPQGGPNGFVDDQQPAEQNETVSGHIISSLKEKIKDLGDQSKNVKCLICMEPYTKPVVSTTCWHVHCEECWLMTMGVKKLCPQCNMIVFPTDLRRIYL